MAADHPRLTAEERADLVAYLDGELPEDRSRALADKLTRSVSGRREVETLGATWELLDLLPRPKSDEGFADRTITMAVEPPKADGRLAGAARGAVGRMVGPLVVAAVVAVSAVVGYAGARWAWPDRTSRLARDLTIAERLDDYRAVGGLDFLRRLDESTLFKEASD